MGLALAFLLGMANFAAQRWVLECGHPVLAAMPPRWLAAGRAASLGFEFVLLVVAMGAAWREQPGWMWLYGGYSALNAASAWAIATRRL